MTNNLLWNSVSTVMFICTLMHIERPTRVDQLWYQVNLNSYQHKQNLILKLKTYFRQMLIINDTFLFSTKPDENIICIVLVNKVKDELSSTLEELKSKISKVKKYYNSCL